MEVFKEIISKLEKCGYTVATMESCTGGGLASEITNHPGASLVLRFSAVTYSNEFKIKMGVSEEVIDKYSVYSKETAKEMALNIANFANSTFGIGITGKINVPDIANDRGSDNLIFYCIYNRKDNVYYEYELNSIADMSREENKKYIIEDIGKRFIDIIN